jgi:hypothetical protein
MDGWKQSGKTTVSSFRFVDLCSQLLAVLNNSSLIVEGILIQDILSQGKIKAIVNIYIKHVNKYGFWYDGQMLHEEASSTLQINDSDSNYVKFQKKLIEYHQRVRPHETADYLLELKEGYNLD